MFLDRVCSDRRLIRMYNVGATTRQKELSKYQQLIACAGKIPSFVFYPSGNSNFVVVVVFKRLCDQL